MSRANHRPSERILVRGVNWLGDAVMTTPALLRLREARPGAHISLLTPEKLADLWVNHPAVDAVLMFRPEEGLGKVARQLRGEGFDLGLVFPNSPRSALELWLARVPRRVGYAASWRRWWLTDVVAPRRESSPMQKRSIAEIRSCIRDQPMAAAGSPGRPRLEPSAHHLHHYLHLVAAVGANPEPVAPRVNPSALEVQSVLRRFGLAGEPGAPRPLLALNPGAEYGPAKRWPLARFAAAAAEVQDRTGCRWVVVGGPGDAALAEAVVADLRRQRGGGKAPAAVSNLAGQTTLQDLCAVLKACRVLLTNDTGPMHLAAALGTPVVVPFGSTSPELTGPGLPGDARHRLLRAPVPCAPCFRRECPIDFRCMHGITVDQVVGAVLEVLDRPGAAGA
jgi:heptosyltransferase-2